MNNVNTIQTVLSSIKEIETEQYFGEYQLILADWSLRFISLLLLDCIIIIKLNFKTTNYHNDNNDYAPLFTYVFSEYKKCLVTGGQLINVSCMNDLINTQRAEERPLAGGIFQQIYERQCR